MFNLSDDKQERDKTPITCITSFDKHLDGEALMLEQRFSFIKIRRNNLFFRLKNKSKLLRC